MSLLKATRLGAMSILLSSAALADDHLNGMRPADLLPLAQAEGTVTVYSFTSRIGKVEKAFEEAYPGIDLQGFDISSTEQIARLQAEAQAGVTNADVIYISDTPVVLGALLDAGIIASYVPPRVADRVDHLDAFLVREIEVSVLTQEVGEPQDCREGRTDLVAHVGKECALGLAGAFGLLAGTDE